MRAKQATSENKIRPPFGVKVERFLGIGYHPRLEVRPGTYKLSEISPGCYYSDKPRRIVSKVQRWKRQEEMEEFSRRLGYHGDHILKKRKWQKSVNGPGWQDVGSDSPEGGPTFPKAIRYPVAKFKAYAVPGPGTYGKHHVPFTRTEEKSRGKGFSFSTLPSFEQMSKGPRSLTVQRSYHLPPNLYQIKTSTEEIVSKTISKRGPYDLFTGERFPDPIVFKTPILNQRLHPLDLNHPKNAYKGVFQKCGKDSQITSRLALVDVALVRKNPSDPGPSYYNPYPSSLPAQAPAPFNTSVVEARPVVKCDLSAPPGRYSQDYKRTIIGDGMKSSFISKVKRTLPQPEKMSWFE